MKKKSKVEGPQGDWNLVSNETFAKQTDSWEDDDGAVHVRHRAITGSPSKVKQVVGDLKNGSKASLAYSHNVQVYERQVHSPSCDGVVKEKEFKVVESDTLGDGSEPDNSGSNDSSTYATTGDAPAPTGDIGPMQILKNIYDNHEKRLNLHGIAIACAIAIGIAAGCIGLWALSQAI